jgi:hypothetical protein
MAERVPIVAPTVTPDGSQEEWIRSIAQAVVRILEDRPSPHLHPSTPTAFSVDQDDYYHGEVDIMRLSASVAVDITGIDANSHSPVYYVNVGAEDITLRHDHTSSAIANRLDLLDGFDVVLDADGGTYVLWYDEESLRWRGLIT